MVAGAQLGSVQRLVSSLGAELDVRVRWRGEELDCLLDATPAAIGVTLVEILTGCGWKCDVKVTFAIRGELGSVDVLGGIRRRPAGSGATGRRASPGAAAAPPLGFSCSDKCP